MTEQPTDVAVASTPNEQPAIPSLASLKSELTAAIAAGNDVEFIRLSKLVLKNSSDIQKVEAERVKKEAESLAGEREKLATLIHKLVKTVVNVADLERMKAKGFTFHLDAPDSNGVMVTHKSVALLVPTVKTRTGTGGGSTGALKQETGMSRSQLIDKYATEEQKATITEAQDSATTRPDSARYTAEKPVIKDILAKHPELIKK